MTRGGRPRSEETRAYHRKEVALGYLLRGESQRAVAKRLGISQAQVALDLRSLLMQWEREAVYTVQRVKAQELQRIDYIFFEAHDAWERSKRPKVSRENHQHTKTLGVGRAPLAIISGGGGGKQVEGPDPSDELDVVDGTGARGGGDLAGASAYSGYRMDSRAVVEATSKSRRSETAQVGDPRFLDKMSWCIEMRCKITGVPLTGAAGLGAEQTAAAALPPGVAGVAGLEGGDAPSFQEIARRLGEGLKKMTPAHRTNALNRFRVVLRMADELNQEILALPDGPVSGGFEEEAFPTNAIIRDGQVVYLDEDEPPARRGEEPGQS